MLSLKQCFILFSSFPLLLAFVVGGLGFEFCVFVAGWRHALRSEWPFIIIIIKLLLLGRYVAIPLWLLCNVHLGTISLADLVPLHQSLVVWMAAHLLVHAMAGWRMPYWVSGLYSRMFLIDCVLSMPHQHPPCKHT